MKNLLKIAAVTALSLVTMPSCASYKYVTFAPCFPEEDLDEVEETPRELAYRERADSLYTKQGDLLYQGDDNLNRITKPDSDSIELRVKLMGF